MAPTNLNDAADFSRRVGATLASLREDRNLSRREVADRAHLTSEGLRKIEAGLSVPNAHTLWQLSRALEIPFGLLATRIECQAGDRIEPRIWIAAMDFARAVTSECRPAPARVCETRRGASAASESAVHTNGSC